MRDAEIALQGLGHAVGQHCQRNGRGVRSDNGPRRANGIYGLIERPFDIEAFHHRLRNPVRIGNRRQIVVDVPDCNQPRVVRVHESRRARYQHALHGRFGQRAGIATTLWNDIQQHYGHAGVAQMAGDAGTHGPGADHCRLSYASHEPTKHYSVDIRLRAEDIDGELMLFLLVAVQLLKQRRNAIQQFILIPGTRLPRLFQHSIEIRKN